MNNSKMAYSEELSFTDDDYSTQELKNNPSSDQSPPTVLGIQPSPKEHSLKDHLQALTALIANATEAYSASIFIANNETRSLKVYASHTLSRDYVSDAEIAYGAGLVGWTAENKVRISVCPFQHDSRTLLYYSADQDLKSFIAIPILSSNKTLLGVLCCDSKKSYAFAKVTENVLHDCAYQAALLFELHTEIKNKKANKTIDPSALSKTIESLRNCKTEEELLSAACAIPQEIVSREALVIITTADRGVGQGAYYSVSRESKFNHRLLELVCRHKKIICADRSVHVPSSNDFNNRSFLSVPFRTLGKEAGSFNILSKSKEAFQASEIATLEQISQVVGEKLEHIRLIDSLGGRGEQTSILSWRQFEAKATKLLNEGRHNKYPLALVRISLNNLSHIEDLAGVDTTCTLIEKIARIIEQIAGTEAASCFIYGSQFIILSHRDDAQSLQRKFNTLLDRISIETDKSNKLPEGLKINQALRQNMGIALAKFPQDGSNLTELMSRTNTVNSDSSWQQ